MGAHRGGLREAARLHPGDVDGLRELRRGVRAISLITLPAFSLASAVGALYVYRDTDIATRVVLALQFALLVWLGGQQKLWANYLRGFGYVRFASLMEGRSGGFLAALCQAVLLGAVFLFLPSSGLAGALSALAAGYAIPVLIAWLWVARRWKEVPANTRIFRDLKEVTARHWHFASNLIAGYV